MKPQTKKILIGAGIAVGALLVVTTAVAASTSKVGGEKATGDVERVVNYAIANENDIAILSVLAAKLTAAGRLEQAAAVTKRVNDLTGTSHVAPMPFQSNPQKTSVMLFR